ncbi:hypothetical protein HDIA_4031 [Hartmannibacter diazotrophicus]|uniref:Uncharacterized protein n=1 Tax=Hartmannibacter diazotrophicus TaxID=1482074 RepID=A0A2C9DB65_9HYPH|nr:hypothetical protein [Hartmannibacter diazotrophicus]SON57572.1 hypothetical protein HDIA_4031 [Hartmannibacter diazotrophicus]
MATQAEWREIAYQRSLGQSGSLTGNIHNAAGYDDYVRAKQSEEANRSWGSQTIPHSVAVRSPVYGGSRQGMSPQGAAFFLSCIAGAGAYLFLQSWPVAGLTFGGSLAVIWLLKIFFESPLGEIVAFCIGMLVKAGLFVGIVSLIWAVGGPMMALSFLGLIAGLIGLACLPLLFGHFYRKFTKTPTGAKVDRFARRLVVATVWLAILYAGYWIAAQTIWS